MIALDVRTAIMNQKSQIRNAVVSRSLSFWSSSRSSAS